MASSKEREICFLGLVEMPKVRKAKRRVAKNTGRLR